jgi:hypothetical protein
VVIAVFSHRQIRGVRLPLLQAAGTMLFDRREFTGPSRALRQAQDRGVAMWVQCTEKTYGGADI